MRWALLLLLAGCTCEEWKATPKAGVRRMAEARLAVCEANHTCAQAASCRPAVWAFCLDAGLEKTCGEGPTGLPSKCRP